MTTWPLAFLGSLSSKLTLAFAISCALLFNNVNGLHFSKKGSAESSWSVSSGNGQNHDQSWSSNNAVKNVRQEVRSKKNYASTAPFFAETQLKKTKAEYVPMVQGLTEALQKNSAIDVVYSLGLPLSSLDTDSTKSVSDLQNRLVSLPVKDNVDAAIIMLTLPTMEDLKTDMVVENFIGAFNGKTRGFLFQPKVENDCDKEEKRNELLNQVRIPSDAASFVVEEAGLQNVELSHHVVLNTAEPIILVLETQSEDARQSARGAVPADCPLMVVNDMSTKGLLPRSLNGVEMAENPILGEILAGVYDMESGHYKLLRDKLSTPHSIAVQIFGSIGEIVPSFDKSNLLRKVDEAGQVKYMLISNTPNLATDVRPVIKEVKESRKQSTLKFPSRNNVPSNLMRW